MLTYTCNNNYQEAIKFEGWRRHQRGWRKDTRDGLEWGGRKGKGEVIFGVSYVGWGFAGAST